MRRQNPVAGFPSLATSAHGDPGIGLQGVTLAYVVKTGRQVDFEHRLRVAEQAVAGMGRGCAWKWLLRSASLCTNGAELLSLPTRDLVALCTAS